MAVSVETTRVFKTSDGRRYMTKKAAMMREAYAKLKSKHPSEGYEGYSDEQWTRFKMIGNRYYRRFRKAVR